MNLLLDSCVVIDYIGRKDPFFKDSERVIAASFFGDAKIWVSGQSLNDAFYVLRKYQPSENVQKAIGAFLEIATTVSLSHADYVRATKLLWEDMEDCLVSLCAEQARADYIITRDKKGFARSSAPAVSPKEWLDIMCAEHGLVYDSLDIE